MTQTPQWESGDAGRRTVRLVLLLVVALAGGFLAAQGGGVAPAPGGLAIEEVTAPPAPRPDGARLGSPLPGVWEKIASAPLAGRFGAAAVWTGSEVLVWGGTGAQPYADGALYDPARRVWRAVARSPLGPRVEPAAVWSGSEVIIAGGRALSEAGSGGAHARPLTDAAAYDPASDTWRTLPPLPFPTRSRGLFVARSRLYAVSLDARPRPVAVLDAGSAVWRLSAGPRGWYHPGDVAAAQAGEVVLIWPRSSGDAVAFDLPRERWTRLREVDAPSTLSGCACRLYGGATGRRSRDIVGYEPAYNRWWRFDSSPSGPVLTTDALLYLVDAPTQARAVDRATGEVVELPRAPQAFGWHPNAVWAGDRLFAWGGIRTLRQPFAVDGLTFLPTTPAPD